MKSAPTLLQLLLADSMIQGNVPSDYGITKISTNILTSFLPVLKLISHFQSIACKIA